MRTLLAAILIVMPFAAFGDDAGIQVDHVWARAAPAGHEGAVYLTITDGGAPDTLTGVTTPIAAEAAVHQSIDDHGVMKMRPAGPLPIEPGKPVTLAPGGYHIMLSGLKQSALARAATFRSATPTAGHSLRGRSRTIPRTTAPCA